MDGQGDDGAGDELVDDGPTDGPEASVDGQEDDAEGGSDNPDEGSATSSPEPIEDVADPDFREGPLD
jgi:hypothetical protein